MSIAAALLASAWLFPALHRVAELAFAPAPGLKVERTAHSESSYELESWSCAMNGQPVPEQYLPKLDVRAEEVWELRILDTHLASADGKPTRVRRAFERASATKIEEVSVDGVKQESGERTGTTALEGCVVLFDDGAAADARRKLEQGECDQALVDALTTDLDLTDFLPRDAKASAWEVPLSALNLFEERSGGIEFTFDGADEDDHVDAGQLERNAEGTWRVQRGEPRQHEGVRVVPLALAGKLSTHSEIDGELVGVPVASGPTTERAELTIEATGELLWDVEHHVLRALALEGAATMVLHTRTKQESSSGTPAYSQDMTFRGRTTIAVEAKIVE
jgi:hypothetical protein